MRCFNFCVIAIMLVLMTTVASVPDASAQLASPTSDDFRRLYGIDMNHDLDDLRRGGRAIGRVVDADKLHAIGFEKVKPGDPVEITNLGAFKWNLEHLPSGRKMRMLGK